MRECPQMAWIIERLGDDLSDADREAIAEHVAHCPECAEQLRRMTRLAPAIAGAADDIEEPREHLSENDLAAFAAHGYDAEGASAIALHLSRCRRCRDAFTAAHFALVQYEREYEPEPWWLQIIAELRMAVGTASGAALLAAAGIAYLAECFLFAVAAGQLLFAWVIPPPGYEAVPGWWPMALVPAGPWRLALLLVLCIGSAIALRSAARALYRAALDHGRGGPL